MSQLETKKKLLSSRKDLLDIHYDDINTIRSNSDGLRPAAFTHPTVGVGRGHYIAGIIGAAACAGLS